MLIKKSVDPDQLASDEASRSSSTLFTNPQYFYVIYRIYKAPPTAELEPLTDGQIAQTDEVSINPLYTNEFYLLV